MIPNRWWFRPAFFIMLPIVMSYIAWSALVIWRGLGHTSASWAKLSGFSEPASSNLPGIVLLIVFYCAVVAVATAGWRLGTDKTSRPEVEHWSSSPLFERRYFYLIIVTSVVGILYSYYKIGSAQNILDSLTTQDNQFTNSLPGNAGLQTLRSATILAAPLSVYLWRKKVIGFSYVPAAVVLLVLNSLIASRLSLFMATLVGVVLFVKSREPAGRARPNVGKKVVAALAVFVVGYGLLAGLNFVRNANYYKAAGVTNPLEMNFYQMSAYLATPAQVSIGVADAVMDGTWRKPGHPIDSMNAAQPTFLQFTKVGKGEAEGLRSAAFYGYSVKLEPNFTTNSVFADTYAVFGLWGWPYGIALYAIAGFLFARLLRYGVVIAGSAGVMAHSMSEVWRTQIVNYGFVIFLLLLTWACAVAARLWIRWDSSRSETADDSRELVSSQRQA